MTPPPPPRPRVSVGVSSAPPAQVCSHDEMRRARQALHSRPCTPWRVVSAGEAGLSVAAACASPPPVRPQCLMHRSCHLVQEALAEHLLCSRCCAAARQVRKTDTGQSALAGRADNGLLCTSTSHRRVTKPCGSVAGRAREGRQRPRGRAGTPTAALLSREVFQAPLRPPWPSVSPCRPRVSHLPREACPVPLTHPSSLPLL